MRDFCKFLLRYYFPRIQDEAWAIFGRPMRLRDLLESMRGIAYLGKSEPIGGASAADGAPEDALRQVSETASRSSLERLGGSLSTACAANVYNNGLKYLHSCIVVVIDPEQPPCFCRMLGPLVAAAEGALMKLQCFQAEALRGWAAPLTRRFDEICAKLAADLSEDFTARLTGLPKRTRKNMVSAWVSIAGLLDNSAQLLHKKECFEALDDQERQQISGISLRIQAIPKLIIRKLVSGPRDDEFSKALGENVRGIVATLPGVFAAFASSDAARQGAFAGVFAEILLSLHSIFSFTFLKNMTKSRAIFENFFCGELGYKNDILTRRGEALASLALLGCSMLRSLKDELSCLWFSPLAVSFIALYRLMCEEFRLNGVPADFGLQVREMLLGIRNDAESLEFGTAEDIKAEFRDRAYSLAVHARDFATELSRQLQRVELPGLGNFLVEVILLAPRKTTILRTDGLRSWNYPSV